MLGVVAQTAAQAIGVAVGGVASLPCHRVLRAIVTALLFWRCDGRPLRPRWTLEGGGGRGQRAKMMAVVRVFLWGAGARVCVAQFLCCGFPFRAPGGPAARVSARVFYGSAQCYFLLGLRCKGCGVWVRRVPGRVLGKGVHSAVWQGGPRGQGPRGQGLRDTCHSGVSRLCRYLGRRGGVGELLTLHPLTSPRSSVCRCYRAV